MMGDFFVCYLGGELEFFEVSDFFCNMMDIWCGEVLDEVI